MTDSCTHEATFPRLDPTQHACAACGTPGARAFYGLLDVPTNTCLQLADAEGARSIARGDLLLISCQVCGFVGNAAFASDSAYDQRYEEVQGYSPTFRRFSRDLARRLVDRHGVRDKRVIDVGCGKGEFLADLCAAGNNRGVGIDPGYRPGRTDAQRGAAIEFITDVYRDEHESIPADVVCCRHTLEHLPEPREFLHRMRRHLGDSPDGLLFLEVPDVLRVLREGAFWDLYYEHCSYFSPGSLARLVRRCGFEILDLDLAYGGQYVLLVARPASGADLSDEPTPLEQDSGFLTRGVQGWRDACTTQVGLWSSVLRSNAAEGARTVVWGSGSKGAAFLTTLGADTALVRCVVDINPHRQGRFMPGTGHPVVAPEHLVDLRPDCVIVMNPIYVEEIREALGRLGLRPDVSPVGATSRV